MPSLVSEIFKSCHLTLMGTVAWGEPVPTKKPGVYIVSLSSDPESIRGALEEAPIDEDTLRTWLERVPQLELDGKACPKAVELAARLKSFWLPDENILYIGKATSLRTRVRQYYNTPLGDRRPHAGGHWLKTLSTLPASFVHFTEVDLAEEAESALLGAFVKSVSESTKAVLRDPSHPFPFANLEFPQGTRKAHGIGKAKK